MAYNECKPESLRSQLAIPIDFMPAFSYHFSSLLPQKNSNSLYNLDLSYHVTIRSWFGFNLRGISNLSKILEFCLNIIQQDCMHRQKGKNKEKIKKHQSNMLI